MSEKTKPDGIEMKTGLDNGSAETLPGCLPLGRDSGVGCSAAIQFFNSSRTFRLSKRLTASLLAALYSFWVAQNAGMTPFVFYNPFDVASGQQIGSNYDPTGNNTQGRVTVVFRGNWAQATDVARTNVQGLELVEVA